MISALEFKVRVGKSLEFERRALDPRWFELKVSGLEIRKPKPSNNTHRPLSSSFLGLPYRTLNTNLKRNYLGACG